ncbi:MAG: hypothetical protein K0Q48_2705 [Bacillota bacterium]|nr:hypothetical protein [Bacillota bacterium]
MNRTDNSFYEAARPSMSQYPEPTFPKTVSSDSRCFARAAVKMPAFSQDPQSPEAAGPVLQRPFYYILNFA